jgi:hypothetical protein
MIIKPRLFMLLVFACLVIIPGLVRAQTPLQNPDMISAQFTIAAPRDWQNTRLMVQPGDRVEIRYTGGMWRSAPDEPLHGPDGKGSYTCYGPSCVEPLPNYPKGALVGQIGNGPVFAVGNAQSFVADQGGALELRINDVGVYDAQGSVTVQIIINWQLGFN